MRKNDFNNPYKLAFCWAAGLVSQIILCHVTVAQTADYNPADVVGYRFVDRTVYVKEPVTLEKWVEETQYENKLVEDFRSVVETERRERRTVVKKPVTRTVMREQRTVVQKPVTETRFRERQIEETSYDVVTELRDERYVVERPVTETRYREEQFTVRQRVTEDLIEVKNQTVYRPQTSSQTVFQPTLMTSQFTNPQARPRIEWMPPGYSIDPATGQSVWRRRGLHWVQPNQVVTTTGYMPTAVEQTVLVPETIQTRRPVEVSRYEDRLESRRVPYEVQRTISETVSRQVPVTVRKPVVTRSVERVPFTETRYVDEERIEQIPVTETVMEEVVEIEPYEVQIERWKPVMREVQIPKTVRRRVEYQEMREVAKVITVRVPIDKEGRALSLGEPVSDRELRSSIGTGSTTDRPSRYEGSWQNDSPRENTQRPRSVLVEESSESNGPMQSIKPTEQPETQTTPADQRPTLNGDETRGPLQSESDLRELTVLRQPTLDLEVRPARRPTYDPNHQNDIRSAER